MPRYSEEYLATLDPEVEALAREQMAESASSASDERERMGGQRVLSLDAFTDDYLDERLASEDNTQEVIDNDTSDSDSDSDTRNDVVAELVATLDEELQDAYDCIYVRRLSIRETANELTIPASTVFRRVERLRIEMEQLLTERGFYAD